MGRPARRPDPWRGGVRADPRRSRASTRQHRGGRDVVGVADPRLVPALGTLVEPARARRAPAARPSREALAGDQVVQRELGDGVARPRDEQQRAPLQLRPVQDGEVLQHGLGVLGEQVAPVSAARGRTASVTASRPRGASQVGERRTAARRGRRQAPVCASTPDGELAKRGAAGSAPSRSASHRSLRAQCPRRR